MNDAEDSQPLEPMMLPDGSLKCGNVIHEPWPSLRIRPLRSLGFMEEILRAAPGSPFWDYTRAIPEKIRALARAMPSAPFSALELCGANPERGYDLLQDCPALAVLVIHRYSPGKHGPRRPYFETMLGKPWRQILADFGLPAHAGTIRILRKLPRDHCHWSNVQRLCDVLRLKAHPLRHVLPHLQRISRDTVSLFYIDPELVSPPLLRASSESCYDEEPVCWTLGSIRSLRAELCQNGPWPYGTLTFEQLKIVEGRLTDRSMPDTTAVFPEPPLVGCKGKIVPIQDWEGLVCEADTQENCALTFVADILNGSAYLYKVYHAERATLVVRRESPTSPWVIHDLRAAQNAEVSSGTTEYIQGWFKLKTTASAEN